MRKLNVLRAAVLSSLLLMISSVAWSEPLTLQQLFSEMQTIATETKTLSSGFVQEKNLAIFSEKLISHGIFSYQAPDRLRWELLTPVASGFVLRGGEGESWNSLSEERNSFSVENDPIMGVIAQQLLAWARVDLDWLQNRYQMELASSQPIVLRLTPRDEGEAGFIDYLQVRFSADRRYIAEVLMAEQGGDSTLLRFTNVHLNRELPREAFQPPEF
jgi:outer membrane lipoprotein-sorting protein